MPALNSLRLSRKLAIGFGSLLLIIAISSALSIQATMRLSTVERLNSESDDAQDDLDLANGDFAAARAAVLRLVVTGVASDKDAYVNARTSFGDNMAALRKILTEDAPDLLSGLDTYQTGATQYLDTYLDKVAGLAMSPGTRSQAMEMVASPTHLTLSTPLAQTFAKLRKSVADWSDGWTSAGEGQLAWSRTLALASGGLCLLIGVLAAWLTTRMTVRPIAAMTAAMRALAGGDHAITLPASGQRNEIGEMAGAVAVFRDAAVEKQRLEQEAAAARHAAELERTRQEELRQAAAAQQAEVVEGLAAGLAHLAQGDLTFSLTAAFAPEYERLRADFNKAVQQLHGVAAGIIGSTGAIQSGSAEIAQASDDLSRRTEQQAASLEQTAAALDEITAAVRRTAEGAGEAQKVVTATRGDAEQSGKVVNDAVVAMNAIEQSAGQIGSIIGVIDEIAFQTNLLALNAGVEAARAGDAGRGFAVVASEVRALAQRSAEAAKEIKALIQTSSRQVGEGVKLVGETGAVLRRIVQQVGQVTVSVSDIAASAQEQATGLHQVNTAVNQMDQVTQQNAAMVEQATAASHALSGEAGELQRLAGQFKLNDSRVVAMPVPADRTPVDRSQPARKKRAPAKMVSTGSGRTLQVVSSSDGWEEF